MNCLYCGKKVGILALRKARDSRFCSEQHRLEFFAEQEKLALARLIDAQLATPATPAPAEALERLPALAGYLTPPVVPAVRLLPPALGWGPLFGDPDTTKPRLELRLAAPQVSRARHCQLALPPSGALVVASRRCAEPAPALRATAVMRPKIDGWAGSIDPELAAPVVRWSAPVARVEASLRGVAGASCAPVTVRRFGLVLTVAARRLPELMMACAALPLPCALRVESRPKDTRQPVCFRAAPPRKPWRGDLRPEPPRRRQLEEPPPAPAISLHGWAGARVGAARRASAMKAGSAVRLSSVVFPTSRRVGGLLAPPVSGSLSEVGEPAGATMGLVPRRAAMGWQAPVSGVGKPRLRVSWEVGLAEAGLRRAMPAPAGCPGDVETPGATPRVWNFSCQLPGLGPQAPPFLPQEAGFMTGLAALPARVRRATEVGCGDAARVELRGQTLRPEAVRPRLAVAPWRARWAPPQPGLQGYAAGGCVQAGWRVARGSGWVPGLGLRGQTLRPRLAVAPWRARWAPPEPGLQGYAMGGCVRSDGSLAAGIGWVRETCRAVALPALGGRVGSGRVPPPVLRLEMAGWRAARAAGGNVTLRSWLVVAPAQIAVRRAVTGLRLRTENDPTSHALAGAAGRLWERWQQLPAAPRWATLALAVALAGFAALPGGGNKPAKAAAAATGGWLEMPPFVSQRAAVFLRDEFRQGLADWEGEGSWSRTWTFDQAGFLQVGPAALYRPSVKLKNYEFEFLGQIQRKGMSWMVRARDLNNYQALRLVIVGGGAVPEVAFQRQAVVDGKAGKLTQRRVPLPLRLDTIYDIVTRVSGDDFTVTIQGQVADYWSEPALAVGGVGLYSEKGEQARVRWVEVRHQNDMLGKLCAMLAPPGQRGAN